MSAKTALRFASEITAVFGVFGVLIRRSHFEPAPLLLGFVFSQPLEENLNRALIFANGELTAFVSHPIGPALIILFVFC
jgi:TctA family transporter